MDIGLFSSKNTVDGLEGDVRQAAELGFPSFWSAQIFDLDTLTALAVIAERVPDIELGTAVVPTYPRHPMMLAQQALTVNQVSGGRLNLGIGLSHQPVVEGMWGISFDRPVKHMSDYLEILMPLLHGQAVSHGGELVTGRGELGISAAVPPVYVAALGPQMLKLTGRLADGTVTWMTGPKTVADHIAPVITTAASEAGRPRPKVLAGVPVCITDDPDAARQRAASDYAFYGDLPSYRAMLDREGYDGPGDVAIIGDAAAVEEGLRRYVDGGCDTIVAAIFGSGDERSATAEQLSTLLG